MSQMHPDIERIVYSEAEIAQMVQRLGKEIERDYASKNLLMVCVLKGACTFLADLMRAINLPLEIDFMAVSSYGSATKSSGVVRVLKDLDSPIQGKDVIIVEDLLDSGHTLAYLKSLLAQRKPASIEIATFLNKEVPNRAEKIVPTYIGGEAPNEFLVGYGFDYDERYRNLPYVGVLKKECYE